MSPFKTYPSLQLYSKTKWKSENRTYNLHYVIWRINHMKKAWIFFYKFSHKFFYKFSCQVPELDECRSSYSQLLLSYPMFSVTERWEEMKNSRHLHTCKSFIREPLVVAAGSSNHTTPPAALTLHSLTFIFLFNVRVPTFTLLDTWNLVEFSYGYLTPFVSYCILIFFT